MGHKKSKGKSIIDYGTQELPGIGKATSKAINYPPGRMGLGGLATYGTKRPRK